MEKLLNWRPRRSFVGTIKGNWVLRANREFTKLFGYTVEESLGRNIRELIVPEGMWEESERLREATERARERPRRTGPPA